MCARCTDEISPSSAHHPISTFGGNNPSDVGEVRRAHVAGRAQDEFDSWFSAPAATHRRLGDTVPL